MKVFAALFIIMYSNYVFSSISAKTLQNVTAPTTVNANATITPITTTKPSPVPVPSNSTYDIHNSSGVCFMLQTDLLLRIPYFNEKGEPQSEEFFLNGTVAKKVIVDGSCTPEYQAISLSWAPTDANATFSTTLNFTLQKKDDVFELASVSFTFSMTDSLFPGTNNTANYTVSNAEPHFSCPLGYYYQCKATQTFELTPAVGKIPTVKYEISNLKVEAFRNSHKKQFVGKLRECTADSVTDRVVPIIVGVVLAVMIIVAIITFIIGSRRRRVGYQSI